MSEKIMVALSGGVDSAVAMTLLKQQGYDVSAAYMKTWMNEEGIDVFGTAARALNTWGSISKLWIL